jgi:hypothetical protein
VSVVVLCHPHRSIYGIWQTALTHFDAFHIGLTATPAAYKGIVVPVISDTRTGRSIYYSRSNLVELVAMVYWLSVGISFDIACKTLNLKINGNCREGGEFKASFLVIF